MKHLSIFIGVALTAAVLLLFSLAPDKLSLTVLFVMALMLILGFVLGVVPMLRFSSGFRRALKTVRETTRIQTSDPSLVVMRETALFRQKNLDAAFQEYREVTQRQAQAGEVLRDLSEFISDDYLSIHSWQGLMVQIPGILTGLGILGTFVGLLKGLGTLTFSTAEAAITSVTTLINGIETAFFTSIAGVILSILFNILYRILWNDLNREYGLFLDCFHKQVVPPTDVQMRQAFQNGLRELFLRLDRLPQDPGYSPVHGIRTPFLNEASEKLLMPQIVQAMEEGQFLFYLQPVVTLKTRKLVGIEALVRWQHDSLGLLTPSAFLPVLEQNAYITKLDLAIWDLACKTIRGWLDSGFRPLPMTLNVFKADFLALDLPAVFAGLLKEYKLPPRSLELDVPANVYSGDSAVIPQVLAQLRGMGLKVTLDNFNPPDPSAL